MTSSSGVTSVSLGSLLVRGVLAWCVIALAETFHGVLRNRFVTPVLGDHRARQVGVFVGSVIILVIAWLLVRWIGAKTNRQLLAIGALWVMLMLTFEMGLGRGLGFSWERILSDYDPSEGGVMAIGMIVLFLSPLLAARVRGASRAQNAR